VIGEKATVRRILIGAAAALLGLLVVLPLAIVVTQALSKGVAAYFNAITHAETLGAARLTLLTAGIAVPLNLTFGLAAAWAITKFTFPGKKLLVAIIDLPFLVSPVIAGMGIVLLYGSRGLWGGWLVEYGFPVVFAWPGLVLATVFVTAPFVARELIPLMQEQGSEEEEAAVVLGANGWQIFRRVTLPKIRWGLLYGVILCNARAMGEFGAVSVVSGHIRGETNTLPLHVEILYNEYQMAAAFAVASLLTLLTVVTVAAATLVQRLGRARRLIGASA
jgi:sulfate/thiosulfate transport system permease protein